MIGSNNLLSHMYPRFSVDDNVYRCLITEIVLKLKCIPREGISITLKITSRIGGSQQSRDVKNC